MKTFIPLFIIILLSINNSHAQDNWEYLGTTEIAEVVKVVKDNSIYYALTSNGIYYLEAEAKEWKIIKGTINRVGYDGFAVVDFYVSNNNIYLIYRNDTVSNYLTVSNDLGKTWKNVLSTKNGIIGVKVSGDTIQVMSNNFIYYSTDGFKNYDVKQFFNYIYEGNDIDVFNPQYVMSNDGRLYSLEDYFGELKEGSKILELPNGFKFLQLLHVDSLIFVWAYDEKDFVLFKINPQNNEITRSLVFGYDKSNYRTYADKQSTFFKHENSTISIKQKNNSGLDSLYISKDYGNSWLVSKSFPRSYKELFDDVMIVNDNHKLSFSHDLGETLIPKGHGILSSYSLKMRPEANNIYFRNGIYNNLQYFAFLSNEKSFLEATYLTGFTWVVDDDKVIYGVKENKLYKWDTENSIWLDEFDINNDNEIWNVYLANEVLFLATNNGLRYSFDKGKNWIDSEEKVLFSEIVFYDNAYFINTEKEILKSYDLKNWTKVGHDILQFGYIIDLSSSPHVLYIQESEYPSYSIYNETTNYFDIHVYPPFSLNLHSSPNNSGFVFLDKTKILAFNKSQGIKYSNDGGQTWDNLDDFDDTKIYDLKVIDGYIYVLNMYGLWRRSAEFLQPSATSEILENRIVISPNPTSNYISIESPQQIISIHIIDLQGRAVHFHQNNQNTIDLSTLENGIYFVRLETYEGLAVKKVVKVE